MTELETCEDCGFAWVLVPREDIMPRATAGTLAIAALLVAEPTAAVLRPSPDRWSMVEYAAHVRDVMLDAVDSVDLHRPVQFGFPGPLPRTLLWMGQQVVHEVEHHRGDIEEDLRRLTCSGA